MEVSQEIAGRDRTAAGGGEHKPPSTFSNPLRTLTAKSFREIDRLDFWVHQL